MKTPVEIGQTVRNLRGDLSLRAFAQKCKMSHTTIDYIEKGVDFRTGKPAHPSVTVLNQIATSCGVSLEYLVGAAPNKFTLTESDLSEAEMKFIQLLRSVSDKDRDELYDKLEFALNLMK